MTERRVQKKPLKADRSSEKQPYEENDNIRRTSSLVL